MFAVPALGRVFDRAEDLPGEPRTAILTYRIWQSRFGGDPRIAGRTILLTNGLTRWPVSCRGTSNPIRQPMPDWRCKPTATAPTKETISLRPITAGPCADQVR